MSPSFKKGSQAVALAMGLFLLLYSLTLMSKPGAGQGVQALPQRYATTVGKLDISAQPSRLSDAGITVAGPLSAIPQGKSVVSNTTSSLVKFRLSAARQAHQVNSADPGKAGEVKILQPTAKKNW